MNWRAIFSDIRFWICIGFALRLITIDATIFDSHKWRQADGYAVARNFLEEDSNTFNRRVDNRGGLTGIALSEFQSKFKVISENENFYILRLVN